MTAPQTEHNSKNSKHNPNPDNAPNDAQEQNTNSHTAYKEAAIPIFTTTFPQQEIDGDTGNFLAIVFPRNGQLFIFNTSTSSASFIPPVLVSALDTSGNPIAETTREYPWLPFFGPTQEDFFSYHVENLDFSQSNRYQIDFSSQVSLGNSVTLDIADALDTTPPDDVHLDVQSSFSVFGDGFFGLTEIIDQYNIQLSPSATDDFLVSYFEVTESIDGAVHDQLIVPIDGRLQTLNTRDNSYTPHERCYTAVAVDSAGNRSVDSDEVCVVLDRTSGCTQTSASFHGLWVLLLTSLFIFSTRQKKSFY